jgi:hypothetical protein
MNPSSSTEDITVGDGVEENSRERRTRKESLVEGKAFRRRKESVNSSDIFRN